MYKIKFLIVGIIIFIFSLDTSRAQSSTKQGWTDADIVYPFLNTYSVDAEIAYQTLLSSEGKWRSFGFTPTIERVITQNVDLIFALPLSYTWQTDTLNTSEVRLSFGTRLHFTPNRRVLTRLLIRYEPRFVHQEEQDITQKSNRLRVRAEAIIPINRKSYFEDKLLYGLVNYEQFIVKDVAVQERYANRYRSEIGMGYRFSYAVRLEAIYASQNSRNTINDTFSTTDDIFWIRFKYFLHAAKLSRTDGSQN